jgi:hypothetical protein
MNQFLLKKKFKEKINIKLISIKKEKKINFIYNFWNLLIRGTILVKE